MRLYRLLAMVMYLINRDRVTAKELAEYFEVSQRTIYRDLETINQAGIPIVAYQGANGGFGIMENYKIDRNLLTPDEMMSILVALKGVSKTLGDRAIAETMEKIKGLIPENKREKLDLEGKLIIDFNPWGSGEEEKEKIRLLRKAIESERTVEFLYRNPRGENTQRQIEPLTLILRGYSWYLYGYCLLRGDFRLFKLSRIKNLVQTDKFFVRRENQAEGYPWEKEWVNNAKIIQIVLVFKPEAGQLVEEYFAEDQIEEQDDGRLIVNIGFPEDEWVYGFILGFGDKVEVLKPPHLREIIKTRIASMYKMYRHN